MNCEQMTQLISAYVDGETNEQEEKQLFEHLEQCAHCRALLEQLQTLHASFTELEEIPAPEGFADRVMEQIRTERKSKVVPLFRRPQIRALTGLAACAVLCIGLMRGGLGGMNKAESAAPAAMAPDIHNMEVYQAVPETSEENFGLKSTDSAPVEIEIEAPADAVPECAEPPAAAPEEPAAPAPEYAQSESGLLKENAGADSDALRDDSGELPCIILNSLPVGVEALGDLYWEKRESDGAPCVRLNEDQARTILALALEQGLSVEQTGSDGGEAGEFILLVLE